jgi:hypothetical protein
VRHEVFGGWVEFPSPDELTNGVRKAFMRRLRKDDVDNLDKADLAIISFMTAWSFPVELPTMEANTLDDLPVKTVDGIYIIAADLMRAINPNFEPNPDPKSPTVPSTA